MTFPRRSPTPPSLRRIVEKCMEIDPFDRYQDFDELIHCLKRFLDGKTDGNRALTLRPFVRWARHPRRPLDACFFLIPLNLIMMLWMMINAAIISSPLYHGDSRNGDLILCLGIGLGYNLVVAILCSLRILGQRWGTWLALPMALLVKISVPLLTIFDLIPTFSGLYEETPFFRVANHAQIFLIGSFEVTALLISVYSDFSVARRKELSKDQERFEGKPSSSTKVRKQDTKIERP